MSNCSIEKKFKSWVQTREYIGTLILMKVGKKNIETNLNLQLKLPPITDNDIGLV